MAAIAHLYADQFGAYIGKHSERLRLSVKGTVVQQAPLVHLQSVTIAGMGVSISADAIAACCERGIPIFMISPTGDVYASLYSAGLVGTALTRRAQISAYDGERGAILACAISAGKVRNQAATLRYWASNRREAYPDLADSLIADADSLYAIIERIQQIAPAPLDGLRDGLMGYEGAAAARYWSSAAQLIPPEYSWTGRIGRGAGDPVNSLLNYGYGILYAEVERAVVLAGLDPYAGFLHADRPGKPSLVLDMIEEFRQIAVDRPVIGLVARRYRVTQDTEARLTDDTRRDFAQRILETLGSPFRYAGSRAPLRHIIQTQMRMAASFLRGDRDRYVPFEAQSG